MPLRNDQCRGHQRWRLGKESTEERVIAVGPIDKSDERRGVDVGLSLSAHRPRRRSFAMRSDRPFLPARHSASMAWRRPPAESFEATGATVPPKKSLDGLLHAS